MMLNDQIYGIEFNSNCTIIKEDNIIKQQSAFINTIYKLLTDQGYPNEHRYELVMYIVHKWTSLNTINGAYRNVPY